MLLGFPYFMYVVHNLTASCFRNPRTQTQLYLLICTAGWTNNNEYWHCPNCERFNLIPTHTRCRKHTAEKARAGISWFQNAKVKASHGLVTTVEAGEWPGFCGCRRELHPLTTRRNCLDLLPTQDPVFLFLATAWGIKVYLPMTNSVSAFSPVIGKFLLHWTKFCFDPRSIDTEK